MKLEYILIVIGALLAVWSQIFLHDESVILRVILTVAGIALAGSSFEIAKMAKKAKKGDK